MLFAPPWREYALMLIDLSWALDFFEAVGGI
jgi:hypothetical protein